MSFLKRLFHRPNPTPDPTPDPPPDPTRDPPPDLYGDVVSGLLTEMGRTVNWSDFDLKASRTGERLLAAGPEEQREAVLAMRAWISGVDPADRELFGRRRQMYQAMTAVLRRRLPFEHDDVLVLLDWSLAQPYDHMRAAPQMIKVVEDYLREHEPTPTLEEKIARLSERLFSGDGDARRWARRLGELGGLDVGMVWLVPGVEPWADAVLADVAAEDDPRRAAWGDLLRLCAASHGSKPSGRWSGEAETLVDRVGPSDFREAVLRWLSLAATPRAGDTTPHVEEANADVLKGLVWVSARWGDRDVSRALTALALATYKKVPGLGPRCPRVGNACVWALGDMPGGAGAGQLALLGVRVKSGAAQKGIEKALHAAAERAGLPREEVEEMAVPAYGLAEVGGRREKLGDFTAELSVTGTGTTGLRWVRPDGKPQKSVPQAVKERHAEGLRELKDAAKDIQKMLPAQRDRIEGLYLEEKRWPYPVWRERYLDHPLVGTLARRLIWRFLDGETTATGIWHEGHLTDREGRAIEPSGDEVRVELWHPMGETSEEVLAWRDRLAELEVRQPFKQAHREVYLLTDAERATHTYSNRFASHVLKQHQFNALCADRGWKNSLRLMVDDIYPPATRPVPAHGLRAEFWVDGIGANYGADTNETGTYLYVATDQVRFYPLGARENYSRAGGGSYGPISRGQEASEGPLALAGVPPLVLSEVMRDADLFVGVASVGNDPNWSDGGPEGRFRDYWAAYSFGGLTATAETRKQVLAGLVPRLKISDRCRLAGRFLVVRGDVRTYKIHLGSGNVLMDPNDQYLCIVPSRAPVRTGRVFLPFEGDNTLAVILSKAFLLAEDARIEDPTILRQIRG